MASQGGSSSLLITMRADGQFLLVKDQESEGWCMPSKKLNPDENFREAAESAAKVKVSIQCIPLELVYITCLLLPQSIGVNVALEGILRVEHSMSSSCETRVRVIFLAESPREAWRVQEVALPVGTEVQWFTVEEMEIMRKENVRFGGDEPLTWANYIQKGEFLFVLYH